MLNISEIAAAKALTLIREEGLDPNTAFLRVGVKSGGCSGLSYEMTFVAESREGDQLLEDQGVRVLVEKKSLLYLLGTTLEYSGGLNGKGFEFKNPNATRTCGCGESFAV